SVGEDMGRPPRRGCSRHDSRPPRLLREPRAAPPPLSAGESSKGGSLAGTAPSGPAAGFFSRAPCLKRPWLPGFLAVWLVQPQARSGRIFSFAHFSDPSKLPFRGRGSSRRRLLRRAPPDQLVRPLSRPGPSDPGTSGCRRSLQRRIRGNSSAKSMGIDAYFL